MSDYSESGSVNNEGFLLHPEVDQMKSVTIPIHSAAILPSPTLLWRVKVRPLYLNKESFSFFLLFFFLSWSLDWNQCKIFSTAPKLYCSF